MITCTMCEKTFEDDEDLKFFGIGDLPDIQNHEDSFHGCPDCETDEYLMKTEE